jgi:outer membrane protein
MIQVMRTMARRPSLLGLGAVALLVVARPGLAQAPVDSLTLDEVIERALQHSPAMTQRLGAVRTAESAERSAWGNFLPNVSISSGTSRSSSQRFDPTINALITGQSSSYNAGISASMDLFTGLRRLATLRQAQASTEAADAALISERFNVILQAKQAYFNVLRADELIRVATAQLEMAREALAAAEQRASVGSATRSDVLRASLQVTTAQRSLLEAESNKATAAFALGRLVGANGPVVAKAGGTLAGPRPLALSDEELEALVLAQAPSVRSAEAALRSAEATASSAKGQYLPTLRLGSSYNWASQGGLDNGRRSWSLNLSASYPLFNGFQREDAVVRADVQVDNARSQLEDARRAARAELHSLLAELRLAEQQIAISEQALQVAQEDLRVQQERYRLGASTMLDQITSLANLRQAELNLVGARYDYQITRARLEALVGREL